MHRIVLRSEFQRETQGSTAYFRTGVENDVLSRGDCPNPNINNAINGQGCMKKLNPPSRLTDGGKFCEIRTRHLCLTISMRSTKRK